MRIEITDEVPPFVKPCCLGCLGYLALAFLAIALQAAGHRARAESIKREKAASVKATRPHTP